MQISTTTVEVLPYNISLNGVASLHVDATHVICLEGGVFQGYLYRFPLTGTGNAPMRLLTASMGFVSDGTYVYTNLVNSQSSIPHGIVRFPNTLVQGADETVIAFGGTGATDELAVSTVGGGELYVTAVGYMATTPRRLFRVAAAGGLPKLIVTLASSLQ